MSKLYNTLEKIRTGEQGAFSDKTTAPVAGREQATSTRRIQWIAVLGISVLVGLGLVAFFTVATHKDATPPASLGAKTAPAVTAPTPLADQSPELSSAMPVSLAPSASRPDTELYLQLNETGIALIHENQHWRGIYSLEQARKLQPKRPEALINMGVALAELGLRAPAKRLFSEAHALAPNHPLLRKNLDLLGQADFFDDQWVASLFAGPTQHGKTPEPQR